MNNAFTVMWSMARCDLLRKAGDEGKPLTVLFGGVHTSAPSLRRAGVGPGDAVFPVLLYRRTVYILARAVVSDYIDLDVYLTSVLGFNPTDLDGLSEMDLPELLASRAGSLGHREPYGCGIEVALVAESSPLSFDVALPGELLESVRFCPRTGKPKPLLHVDSGLLTSSVSLQGVVRRLCPDTASLFSRIVTSQNAG